MDETPQRDITDDSTQPRTMSVVVLNGSPHTASKTVSLATIALESLREHHRISVRQVNVYGIGTGLTSALSRRDVDERAENALRTVEQADLLMVAVPVYRGSYPGMFKHFMDLIERYALVDKPVLLLATGGSEYHAMVIDQVLRPLFAFFQAFVAPVGVYACSADFDGSTLLNPGIYTRITLAIRDLDPLLVPWRAPSTQSISPEHTRTDFSGGAMVNA